jgi:hypothetical protein
VPDRPSQTRSPARRLRPNSLRFALSALLATAIAILLCGPAATLAEASHGACAAATGHTTHTAHACAAHHGSTHKRHKVKRHNKRNRSIKKNGKAKHGSTTSVAPAQEPATCTDGSAPTRAVDGSYACLDGAEPECSNGSEPILAPRRAQLLCPAASSGVEWSEASCDDGSAPAPTSNGGYACADGSPPECEDGSPPIAPDEGSQLACIEADSNGSSGAPAPDSAEEEAEDLGEDSAEDSSMRVATAS